MIIYEGGKQLSPPRRMKPKRVSPKEPEQ
jgi:hypothetical protein